MTHPEERETIINYCDSSDNCDIYTHDKAFQSHIEKELGVKPYFKQGMARQYLFPKKWLRWPRKPSEKRREAARQRIAANPDQFSPKKVRKA